MQSLTHTIGKIFQPLLDLVGAVLAFFYGIIPNYPVDVALLTIVIMALLTPLTVKSTKSMAAMQVLGPEMKKLQQKYKGPENRALLQEEMMKLYKEHNVNPASGCLPMLLQMPAFIILYDVIRGITNVVPKGSVQANGQKCLDALGCAAPRYIPHNTKMYVAITHAQPPGSLHSFGMNFALKLLSPHPTVWAAIPYFLLVVAAVGLQYLQMSRLNARNPSAKQANPQAAAIQKYMPLIFGFIYLNVAAIINVYFIVSSAIRLGTQEVLFHRGLVPGTAPMPAKNAGKGTPAAPKAAKDGGERTLPKATGERPAAGGSSGSRGNGSKGGKGAGGAGPSASGDGGSGNGSGNGKNPASDGAAGAGDGASPAKPKAAHPRSKNSATEGLGRRSWIGWKPVERRCPRPRRRCSISWGSPRTTPEFVVLSEPKAGLFGRMRGEASVQARVRPVAPPPKRGRRQRSDRAGPVRARAMAARAAGTARAGGSRGRQPPRQ